MQCKCGRVCVAIVSIDLRDGSGIARDKCVKQFLRLTLELIEIRMLANLASGQTVIHMSSFLCGCAICADPLRPVSACSGRKEFSQTTQSGYKVQGDAVLPADTEAS